MGNRGAGERRVAPPTPPRCLAHLSPSRHGCKVLTAGTDHELETAFAAAVEQKVGAQFITIDPFLFDRRQQIAALAAARRVPPTHPLRGECEPGALMSYGASFVDAWRQSGIYVGRISERREACRLARSLAPSADAVAVRAA